VHRAAICRCRLRKYGATKMADLISAGIESPGDNVRMHEPELLTLWAVSQPAHAKGLIHDAIYNDGSHLQ
jgi:hypothetical protein